jgi:hypothetical protein
LYKPGGTNAEAIGRIQSKQYVLPAIQREFVWKPEQIERLFDSLMQGYPFGTFLFWKVPPETSGKFKFYDFVRRYHQRDAAHCPELGTLHHQSVTAKKAVIRFLASAQAACLNKCVAIEGAAHTLRVVRQLPARDTERVKLTLWCEGPFLEDRGDRPYGRDCAV